MQRKEYTKKVSPRDASKLKIGIVVSRFNSDITGEMLKGARETLREWHAEESNIDILHVPGSFEIPLGCLKLLKRKPDAIIALGCIIKGDTDHDRYIAKAVSQGLMNLTVQHGTPISFGVITTNNVEQARVRSTGKTNKGKEAAIAALEMALL